MMIKEFVERKKYFFFFFFLVCVKEKIEYMQHVFKQFLENDGNYGHFHFMLYADHCISAKN